MLAAEQHTDAASVPDHVAIIMDGNGRWAKAHGLPRIEGHRRGVEAVRKTVKACQHFGIQFLTLYAFSSENWTRPAGEVDDLMGLLRLYLRREINELRKNNVRLNFIGDRTALAGDINRLINDAESRTGDNSGLTLTLALNYGSQAEIVRAARRIGQMVADGSVAAADIDAGLISRCLDTASLPDPDLIIRTSGEKRLSNFLLWQSAYAELVFLDCLWPDFDQSTLAQAIGEFAARERRFGGPRG